MDDGTTMVVIESGHDPSIGKKMFVVVTKVLQSPAGRLPVRMIVQAPNIRISLNYVNEGMMTIRIYNAYIHRKEDFTNFGPR